MITALLLAAAGPIPYVARGNEPFWRLAVGRSMRLEQAGRRAVTVRTPPVRASFNGERYVARGLAVDVTHVPCTDTMSGQRFHDQVTVVVGRRVLKGCGGAALAADRRADTRWSIAALNGEPVRLQRPTEVRFADGRISGRAGCNSFSGPYRLDGETLTAGPLISTRMACPGPAMAVERDFLRLLGGRSIIHWVGRDGVELAGPNGRARLTRTD